MLDRNTAAHHPFGPSDDKTKVKFLVISAKGELQFPNVEWTEDDFDKRFDQLDKLSKKMKDLAKALESSRPKEETTRNYLAEALLNYVPKTEFPSPAGPGILSEEFHQAPESPNSDSDEATPPESPESDQEPEA